MRRIALLVGLTAVISFVFASAHRSAHAGTALKLDIDGLVQRSELVIEGRVLSRSSRSLENGLIVTDHVVAVDRTLLGSELPTRTVTLPGGVLPDGRGMMVPGMPSLAVQEDVVLFLSRSSSWGMRTPVGLAQGKLRVVTALDGTRSLTRSLAGVTFADGESGASADVLGYAQTIAEIHAAVARRGAPPGAAGDPVDEASNGEER